MNSIRMNHLAIGNGERVLRYTGRVNYGDVVNVGTIGHVDWGRLGYQSDITKFLGNVPYREVRSLHDVRLTDTEVFELWCNYIRLTEGIAGDYDIAKYVHGAHKKEDPTYLGFENGGLIVGGKVIWILADKEYRRFHKKAAEWVLPSKEYVKAVVAGYFGKGDET